MVGRLVWIGLIAVPVVLALIGALAPPTAKDTLLYHFAVPKAFVAQGSNAFVEGNIASDLVPGAEMHNVWAMLLGVASSAGAALRQPLGLSIGCFSRLLACGDFWMGPRVTGIGCP